MQAHQLLVHPTDPNTTEPIAGAELLLFYYDTNRRSLVGSENGVCFHDAISWCKLCVPRGLQMDLIPENPDLITLLQIASMRTLRIFGGGYPTNRRSLVGSENGDCFHGAISKCHFRVF